MSQLIRTIVLLGTCLLSLPGQASITVGGTRLIYNGAENEASLPVSNSKDAVPYLIQSWIELSENSKEQVPLSSRHRCSASTVVMKIRCGSFIPARRRCLKTESLYFGLT